MCEFHDSNGNGFGLNERMYEKIKVNLIEKSLNNFGQLT